MEVFFSSTPYGSGFLWTSHDLLIWTTSIRLRTATPFLPHPPVLHNSSTNSSRNPQLPPTTTGRRRACGHRFFSSAGNRLFASPLRSRPPCHSRSISQRESIRAGLSRKRGTRLRRENISDSQLRGMCNLIPQRARVARHSKLLCSWYPTPVKWLSLAVSPVVSRLFVIPMPLYQ